MANHIVPLILNRIKVQLTATLITAAEDDDPIKADIVKVGRFQDNPNTNNIYAAIQSGDPDDLDFKDGIVSLGDFEDIALKVPAREIGGGEMWWRRGIIQYGCFFHQNNEYTEEQAMTMAYNFLGRIQGVVEDLFVADLVDDYGEQAYYMFPFANTFTESGGPPKSYIWRGRMYWQCLTEKP